MSRYLNKNQILSLLRKHKYLVIFDGYNGVIRDRSGDEYGNVSQKMCEKILSESFTHNIQHVGNGTGLLENEKYYTIKIY